MDMLRYLRNHPYISVTGIAFLLGLLVQFSVPLLLSNDDGYRHIMFARLWREHGFGAVSAYPWLPFSVLHTASSDPWFGFHALLVPFTYFGTLAGLKVWNALILAGAAGAAYGLFRTLKLTYPLLWVGVLLFAYPSFFFRMQIGRPFALTHVLVILTFIALMRRWMWLLFLIGAAFALLHHIFPIFIFIVGVTSIVLTLNDRSVKTALFSITAAVAGTALGVVAHPHLSNYLSFALTTFSIINAPSDIFPLGAEVRPGTPFDYVGWLWMALPVWIAALYVTLRVRLYTREVVMFGALSVLFFILGFASKRFFDYFWISAVPFVALVCSRALFRKDAWKHMLRHVLRTPVVGRLVRLVPCTLIFGTLYTTIDTGLKSSGIAASFREAMQATVRAGIPPGDIIFNPSWDRFPLLFYFYPAGHHVAGMDPYLLYAHSPERYFRWWHISNGDRIVCGARTCASGVSIEESMRNDFLSHTLVFEPARHKRLAGYVDEQTRTFKKIFKNNAIVVYQLQE